MGLKDKGILLITMYYKPLRIVKKLHSFKFVVIYSSALNGKSLIKGVDNGWY